MGKTTYKNTKGKQLIKCKTKGNYIYRYRAGPIYTPNSKVLNRRYVIVV